MRGGQDAGERTLRQMSREKLALGGDQEQAESGKRASAGVCVCGCSAGTEEEEGRTEGQFGGWGPTEGPGTFVSVGSSFASGAHKAGRWRRITAAALKVSRRVDIRTIKAATQAHLQVEEEDRPSGFVGVTSPRLRCTGQEVRRSGGQVCSGRKGFRQ